MFNLGDYGPRSSFPDLSTFFVWQFPFYIFGLIRLFINRSLKNYGFVILSILFIAPIPASLTRDPYSTIRALPLVVPQISIIALGIVEVFNLIKNRYLIILSYLTLLIFLLYSIAKLYSSVIILNEYYRARYWDYGWKDVTEVIKLLDKNSPIIVDNARTEAYIEILFYLKSILRTNNWFFKLYQF